MVSSRSEISVASVQDNTSVAVQGSVLALLLYDVCEEIRLEDLRKILGAVDGTGARGAVTPGEAVASPLYQR